MGISSPATFSPATFSSATFVDPAALQTAARRLDAAADAMLAVLGGPLRELRFTASGAGRDHSASGGEVRAALDGLVADASRWVQGARELAGALEACVAGHLRREAAAAAALR